MSQGTYTATNLPVDGQTIDASDVNTDLQGLIDEFNKLVGTAKLDDGGVTGIKLSTGAITLGYAEATTDQTGIVGSAVDLTSLTVTVTVPSGGRRIKITGKTKYQTTGAGDTATLNILEGSTGLSGCTDNLPAAGVSDTFIAISSFIPTSGSHTYKLQGIRAAGGGSITSQASATDPAFILVELI